MTSLDLVRIVCFHEPLWINGSLPSQTWIKQVIKVKNQKLVFQSSLGKSHKDVERLVLHMLFASVVLRIISWGKFPWINSSSQNSQQSPLQTFPSSPSSWCPPWTRSMPQTPITVTMLHEFTSYTGRITDYMKKVTLLYISINLKFQHLNLESCLVSTPSVWESGSEGDSWCVILYSHQMEQRTLFTLSVNTPFYCFSAFYRGAETGAICSLYFCEIPPLLYFCSSPACQASLTKMYKFNIS